MRQRLTARGFAWVDVDTEEQPLEALTITGPVGYLRLRREGYAASDLETMAKRLAAASFEEAFVFFKHEDAGIGPRLAADFTRLLAEAAP